MSDIDNAFPMPTGSISVANAGGNLSYAVNSLGAITSVTKVPEYDDHAIEGKMLTIINTIEMDKFNEIGADGIKSSMLVEIARKLVEDKCVEFTKQEDYMNQKVYIRARIFVTPDDRVRLLRTLKK